MNIVITRKNFLPNCTIGTLEVAYENDSDSRTYICDTLEPHAIDWSKEKKVKGKTAIPCGQYRVVYKVSKKFRQKMPFLANVPNFEGIMFHWGNNPIDTQGCILVGFHPASTGKVILPRLTDSRKAFAMLDQLISHEINKNGKEVTVRIAPPTPDPSPVMGKGGGRQWEATHGES